LEISVFSFLEFFEDFIWEYLGVPAVVILGITLTIQSRAFQLRNLPTVLKRFLSYFFIRTTGKGVHPIKAFFACVGGCVGVGNIVGICTAVQIGGPGALFWIWVTAIIGMVVKYAEVYLGIKYRVQNPDGTYSGGPMYFLRQTTKKTWVPIVVCLLLCVYGVEVYQFRVITESLSENFNLHRGLVTTALVFFVLFAGRGGVSRVGSISSYVIPVFVVVFIGMGLWVLAHNLEQIPIVLSQVFTSAFTGSSAVGGFFGSTIMMTMSQGIRRGCYTGDVGVGYASVIHSESEVESAEKQASLVIVDIFLDTFVICTMSVMMILTTGIWSEPMEAGMLVQTILRDYFPGMDYYMPLFLLFLGYSTITAYFVVGLKCAEFVSQKWGRICFNLYAVFALVLSVFVDTSQAQAIMAISGGLLLLINSWGIWKLRKEVSYSIQEDALIVPSSV
jgi:alanine or glycine:cation symporter, AGCS family